MTSNPFRITTISRESLLNTMGHNTVHAHGAWPLGAIQKYSLRDALVTFWPRSKPLDVPAMVSR